MGSDGNPAGFEHRHIGPDAADRDAMLAVLGYPTLDALVDAAVPAAILTPAAAVPAAAGPAARAAISSATAPTMSRAPIPASMYIPDRPRRVTARASTTAPAISGNPAAHTAVT